MRLPMLGDGPGVSSESIVCPCCEGVMLTREAAAIELLNDWPTCACRPVHVWHVPASLLEPCPERRAALGRRHKAAQSLAQAAQAAQPAPAQAQPASAAAAAQVWLAQDQQRQALVKKGLC